MNALDDVNVLTRSGYRAIFQGKDLGPLAQAPKIRFLHSEKSYSVYDAAGKEGFLDVPEKRSAEIVLYLKDAEMALSLVSGSSAERSGALLLRPCGPGKGVTMQFPCGKLLPEADFSPEAEKEHSVRILYRVFPESASGKLFAFA